jgi:hypothetical protein
VIGRGLSVKGRPLFSYGNIVEKRGKEEKRITFASVTNEGDV